MTESDKQIAFPNYPPPHGLDTADPRQAKPLMKMVKMLMKPPGKRDKFHTRQRGQKKRKTVRFY